MKIFIPKMSWVVDFHKYMMSAFVKNKIEVVTNPDNFRLNKYIHLFHLHQIPLVQSSEMKHYLKKYNEAVLEECIRQKPDIFLIFNESKLYPDTIKSIREKCGCIMVCILGDDPWDSARYVADFPHSLKYYHYIFNPELCWNTNIRKVAPNARIYWHYAGFDPDHFFPIDPLTISEEDRRKLSCELSFTGTSYGHRAEGAYRADLISYVADYDLKIWGDSWEYRFKFLPELKDHYYGDRLTQEDLRKLYTLSKINLNLPAPQLSTCFQPRTFEIAATKGFQIIDKRRLLWKLFDEDELVTFDTIPELREKIEYYLTHEKERQQIIDHLYNKVKQKYTWQQWAQRIIGIVRNPDNYEMLHDQF